MRAEHDAGAFLRTHILRPTWHFVAPEDLRWILDLTSPRVLSAWRAGTDSWASTTPGASTTGSTWSVSCCRTSRFAPAQELGAAFGERGSPITPGEQLGHLLLVAELRGLVCSGPMSGVHHTYALVDEVVPPTPRRHRDEALVELVRRFFRGHGPASVKDFTRWSSLTGAETRQALAELGDELEQVVVDGIPHWFDPARRPGGGGTRPRHTSCRSTTR